jgi:hypothetical protein
VREPRKVPACKRRYPHTDFVDVAATVHGGQAAADPLATVRDWLYAQYEDRTAPLVVLAPLADLLAGGDWIDRLVR